MSGEVTATEAGHMLGMSHDQVLALLRDGTLVHRESEAGVMVSTDSIRTFKESERARSRAAMADLAALKNDLGLTD